MTVDVGLTQIALAASNLDKSIAFYARYACKEVVHDRIDAEKDIRVIWLSDKTRPFVIVLFQLDKPKVILEPLAHLGVGCSSREEVDSLSKQAKEEGVLIKEPTDSGYPVGYCALLKDPDGHTLELSYGQEIGLTIDKT
jgi:predicted lactoylglutathione lyase